MFQVKTGDENILRPGCEEKFRITIMIMSYSYDCGKELLIDVTGIKHCWWIFNMEKIIDFIVYLTLLMDCSFRCNYG